MFVGSCKVTLEEEEENNSVHFKGALFTKVKVYQSPLLMYQ